MIDPGRSTLPGPPRSRPGGGRRRSAAIALSKRLMQVVPLAALGVDDSVPPSIAELPRQGEAIRYGGESIEQHECRKLLTALEAVSEVTR